MVQQSDVAKEEKDGILAMLTSNDANFAPPRKQVTFLDSIGVLKS
jgi:hypothetical protein